VKLSRQTKEVLHGLRGLGDDLVVCAPERFAVFGSGQHDGLVARGNLLNSFDHDFAIVDFRALATAIKPTGNASATKTGISVPSSSAKKQFKFSEQGELKRLQSDVDRLEDLFQGRSIGSFDLPSHVFDFQRKLAREMKPSHICVRKDSDKGIEIEGLDIRVRLEGAGHPLSKLDDRFLFQIDDTSCAPFEFWIKAPSFFLMPLSTYEITIYEGGIGEFIALDRDVTYIVRDQRIGEFLAKSVNVPPDPDTLS